MDSVAPTATAQAALPAAELDLFFSALRLSSLNAKKAKAVPCDTAAATATADDADKSRSAQQYNRVSLTPSLTNALAAYRMAATNLPIDTAAVDRTREAMLAALRAAYADEEELLKQIELMEAQYTEARAKGGNEVKAPQRAIMAFGEDMQSMQEIIPGLYCGSYHPAGDKELLHRHGITHILCCIGTAARFPADFMYLTVSADDSPTYNISTFFERTFDFIENALIREGGAVLVHCGAGISRAPTITAAYLIRKLRLTSGAAVDLVQSRRPYASPNPGFRKQLKQFAIAQGIEK